MDRVINLNSLTPRRRHHRRSILRGLTLVFGQRMVLYVRSKLPGARREAEACRNLDDVEQWLADVRRDKAANQERLRAENPILYEKDGIVVTKNFETYRATSGSRLTGDNNKSKSRRRE